MSRPMWAAMPVSTTTDKLVKAVLTRPGTPTLRMSANSSQRGAIPRNVNRTSARPECRYQTNHAPPAANGSTSPQAAPAAPSGGSGPKPKIRVGEIAMCATTQATRTPAGKRHVAGAAHRIAHEVEQADRGGATQRHIGVGERGVEHVVLPAHQAKQGRPAEQHQAGEDCAERQREQEGVEDERVGAFGLSGADGARDRRRD